MSDLETSASESDATTAVPHVVVDTKCPGLPRCRIGLRKLVGAILASLATAIASGSVNGQAASVVITDDRPACTSCRILVDSVVSMGSLDGPDATGLWPVVTRDPMGRYLLADESNDGWMLAFDSTGRFLRQIGRRGKGPGEYQFIRFLVSDSSYTYVFDEGNRRLTVLDTAFDVVRTTPLAGPLLYSVAVLADGTPLLASSIPTRGRVGQPFHVLDQEGKVARSFGAGGEGFRAELLDQWARVISGAGQGAFWATRINDYVLELWSVEGSLERRVVRRPSWFAPLADDEVVRDLDQPPRSRIFAIQRDSVGYLWVLTGVAGGKWREGLAGGGVWRDPSLYYDTMVEVIDPDTGQLLAAALFQQFLYGFAGNRLAHGQSLDGGVPKAHVWRLDLIGGR